MDPTPPSSLSYDQAMRFWYGRVNYEQSSPRPSDLRLDRMRALMELLGNPHQNLRIVHVAGSKGKGSTSAMLAAVMRKAGYRTGLFTSPHLERVEERIQVDGEPIRAAELASLMGDVQRAVDALERQDPSATRVTFFEVATALGFLHFVRRRVELAVVEVGLGGRFDSTNVCLPLLSILTSISFDHTQQLGNTLAQIAFEKAGIVKPGRPALSGVRVPEARGVIERICRERGAPLSQLDVDIRYVHEPACIVGGMTRPPRVQVTTPLRCWPPFELGLIGAHQAANAALAVAAVDRLKTEGFHMPDAAVAAGLAEVRWPARLEVVGQDPLVILDCAHNLASVHALLETLQTSFPLADPKKSRRLLIFAGSRDKDLAGMLNLLAPRFAHLYLTRYAHSPRAISPEQLSAFLPTTAAKNYSLWDHAEQALEQARRDARPEDQLCITGSVFVAGELRPRLLTASPQDASLSLQT
jgi:dihydrofolate synthase / folylpolyglutamate synthase